MHTFLDDCIEIYLLSLRLRAPSDPKLLGNERFSSRAFQCMSELSKRIILDEVTAV